MLAIKLRRQGKKHQASYRVVVAEKRSKMRGRFVDDLGWFDPHTKKFDIKKEKVEHWIEVGAKPTDSVHNLLIRAEVIKAPKISVHSTKKRKKKESASTADQPAADEAKTGKEEVKAEPVAEVKEEEVKQEEVKTEQEEIKEVEEKPEKTKSEPEQKTEPEAKKKEPASSADKGEEESKES